jgi:fumarate hydratase class II
MDNDLTLKAAALKLGFVTEGEFNRVVDPAKLLRPYVAQASWKHSCARRSGLKDAPLRRYSRSSSENE